MTTAIKKKSDVANTIDIKVGFPGRDEISLHLRLTQVPGSAKAQQIEEYKLQAIGCPEVLELVAKWRTLLTGDLGDVPLPSEDGHAAMLMRELILRARGEWDFPYKDQELCHCRAVPAAKVDAAIVCGAHTVFEVSRRTSAGTSCGACQPDIQRVLKYRLYR